ncbi:ABC superfamily ATP binding cassette transporter permease protein [Limosilactobacillus frumenti DSM 13145]|uniref:ABC superfamily ATP binding cassette transporter permease protein n=1 Tax=Limosilactobacillus frumenti DSM 13145 TaxID=1423746 RepID=A0A0R1PGS0_9LACO|nr:energy-coupling factor transporter transmembrane component T [Limosilactobacillus frumenti]KRL27672.1 ABC superfamily ATP binding cassette transporter permease protein [Limosilactobacillus frumenti DSM 13145]MBA2913881.1 energy-coupling factor transporter transmembrane protein EcfT [Limosilactobacillus frumenti]QFG73237.1 energy-coupling factor transporter transmembrane protein EcfT [Limosilactobacillus frumenti]
MNPSLKLLLLLLISIEVSFTDRLTANVILAVILLGLLVSQRLKWRQLLWALCLPLIPGVAVMITLGAYSGHNWFLAWVMLSRFYVYVLAGSTLIFTTTNLELVRSLEQNAHLSSKFAYGTLAALNIFPTIRRSVSRIQVAGQMRGVTLHWWSPTLYFKAILAALRWSDQLAQAMEMHGFREGKARTAAETIIIRKRDWLILFVSLVILQGLLIAFP